MNKINNMKEMYDYLDSINDVEDMKYDDYTKCWLKYFKRMQELEKGDSDEI